MNIVNMYVYISTVSFSNKSKYPSKYIGNREFSTWRIAFHRCRRKKWYYNMK